LVCLEKICVWAAGELNNMKELVDVSIVARKYGREKLEKIIRHLETGGLINTAPYMQFKQLLAYLNPIIIEDYQI